MERLKNMKETLMSYVQSQMSNLHSIDAKELGEAVDMIKDLAEAIYYCDVSKAMEEHSKDKQYGRQENIHYYYPPMYFNDGGMRGYSDWDERRYYNGGNGMSNGGNSTRGYSEGMRDYREGRSPVTRRMYMESKEMHHGKEKQRQELEKYMNELTQDIMEMIDDASPEERTLLAQKLETLAKKL